MTLKRIKVRQKWHMNPVERVKQSNKDYDRESNRNAVKQALEDMENEKHEDELPPDFEGSFND